MQITVQNIMGLRPCEEYPQDRVEALWDYREAISPAELAALDIPQEHRMWALVALMSDSNRRSFARRCALDVLELWNCTDVVLRYLHTGDDSLRNEAWFVSWDISSPSATAAANSARSAARDDDTLDAARESAWYAAGARSRGRVWDLDSHIKWVNAYRIYIGWAASSISLQRGCR